MLSTTVFADAWLDRVYVIDNFNFREGAIKCPGYIGLTAKQLKRNIHRDFDTGAMTCIEDMQDAVAQDTQASKDRREERNTFACSRYTGDMREMCRYFKGM